MGRNSTRRPWSTPAAPAAALLLAALAAPAPAGATPEGGPPATPPAACPATPSLAASVTFSPVHLALDVLEVSAEVALGGHVGIALIAGVGRQLPEREGCSGACPPGEAYELGGQLRWYPWGGLKGFHLGAEVLALSLSAWDGRYVATNAQGLSLGAFAGYKVAWRSGLTLEAQLGGQALASGAGGGGAGCGAGCSGTPFEVPILLNLAVGWSL